MDIKREKSCGCIILNDGQILLVGARDETGKLYWSFPKGHQENLETDAETALRETREEVGLGVKIIDEKPIETIHIINDTVIKKVLLFIALPRNAELRLQENEVEKAVWVPVDEAGNYLGEYYRDVYEEFLKRLRNETQIACKVKKEIERIFKKPYGKPTDIIGFRLTGLVIAETIWPIISKKEVCFFDEKITSNPTFHYLDFDKMLEKTEIMIFTVELPKKYYKNLSQLNQNVKIFIPKKFMETISVLKDVGYSNNLVLI